MIRYTLTASEFFQDQAKTTEYHSLLKQANMSNIYHTLQWHQTISDVYGYRTFYVLVEKGNEIWGVLPVFLVSGLLGRRLISIPFSHMVPILTRDDNTQIELLREAQALAQREGCREITLRCGHELPLLDGWQRSEDYYDTLLPLHNGALKEIWANLGSSARRAVRKANKENVQIVDKTTDDNLSAFYNLMLTTRRRQGVPIYPQQFFKKLTNNLGSPKQHQLLIAYLGQTKIAGTLLLHYKNRVIYGYAASVDNRSILRHRPADKLVWESIKYSCTIGATAFDFGRTPATHNSLLRFKEKWGGTSRKIPYYTWVNSDYRVRVKREGQIAKLVSAILRKLPDAIYIQVSSFLIKQLD